MTISDKAFHFFMYLALGCLALGVFGSTSLLGVYITALGLGCLIYYFKNPKDILSPPKSSYPLLIIVVLMIISFGLNYSEAEEPFRMLRKLKYFLAASLAIIPIQYFFKRIPKKHIRLFSKLFIFSIAVAAIYGFVGALNDNQIGDHVFEGLGSRSGGLTDIMRFSYGLTLVFPLVLMALIGKQKDYLPSKRWLFVLIVLIIFGIITAKSRGAIVGVGLALPLCFYFKNKRLAVSLVVLMTITASVYIYEVQTNKGLYQISRVFQGLGSQSNIYRLSQFKTAYHAIKEKPLLGHGMGRFKPQVKRIKHQYDLPYKNFVDQHSHNVFLEITAQLGLIGLFAFLSWFILWGRYASTNKVTGYFLPFVAVFFVVGQFEQIFLTNNMILTFSIYQFSLLNFQTDT